MALPLYLQHLLLTKLESKKYIIKWKGLSYLHICTAHATFIDCFVILQLSIPFFESCSLLFYQYSW